MNDNNRDNPRSEEYFERLPGPVELLQEIYPQEDGQKTEEQRSQEEANRKIEEACPWSVD